MSKTKAVSTLAARVMEVAPELNYVATYNADDPQMKACLQLYKKRPFVYVLTIRLAGREACIYVGKSRAQYERILQHRSTYAFDKIHLFECDPSALKQSEAAVIRLLEPIFNKQHNPKYMRYERVLRIDHSSLDSRETVVHYLECWDAYCSFGLYGFALPQAIYHALKREAQANKLTVSEKLTELLETFYSDDLVVEPNCVNKANRKTNLVTTEEYAASHHKSREQIKQYLNAGDRLGGVKLGRDWVIIDDENFPEDRRKKTTVDQPMFC